MELPLYTLLKSSPTPRSKLRPRLLILLICLPSIILFIYQHLRLHLSHPPSPDFALSAPRNPAYLIKAKHGAVATENEICSNMGVDVLKAGGNAVDAIVTTTLCIGVVSMFSSGIGGGGFMTVRIPPTSPNTSATHYTIDFRETAPAASNATMYVGNPLAAMFGGLAVGVPGELRGLEEAHKRWGTVEWSKLVDPVVELAKGWKVGRELDRRIHMDYFKDLMLKNPDWSSIFAPHGTLLTQGQTIHRTNLSRTLSLISTHGAEAFYTGPIAESILSKINATGGIMTQADLDSYRPIVMEAVEGRYRGRKVWTTGAPTSGPVLIHMLNLAERFGGMAKGGEGRTEVNVHRVVEIMKFGFAARTKICDPAFNDDPARMNEITEQKFADLIWANITDDRTHPPEYYNPQYDVPIDHGTSHSSVVDKDGMAVSLTSTVNLVFGSQVMDPVTGVILNDEMDDFSTPGVPNAFGLWPSPYNYPEPHKRPLSSTAPTILENADGSFYLALGGSGGSRIFPALFQVILGLDWGLDIGGAVEFGRVHDQLYPLVVDVDDVYPERFVRGLRERGHNVTLSDINRVAAVVQGVMMENGTIYAASDSRKNGIAAGY
ncbi:hypothetical protein JAAARDRAFT_47513 [Jaapia argillacea MUCL 33604]|uniref:Glutathione hydrolase n=1 Tax=Jaapia argillacea MUCL 33604 TaxID=933084 RepID=A0A067PS95_9AGAM|nr:hypothetical protein JAAARDRAFT_47513 [Jaapia argillacea MUCL 33604]